MDNPEQSRRKIASLLGLGGVVGAAASLVTRDAGAAPEAEDAYVESIGAVGTNDTNTLRGFPSNRPAVVTVGGYRSPGDGGGGVFVFDPDSTEADNGGTVIKPRRAVPPGRWRRLDSGPIDVRWFGARGDEEGGPAAGAGNDAAFASAFQAALRTVPHPGWPAPPPCSVEPGGRKLRITGALVRVPAGNYFFNSTLSVPDGIRLVGDASATPEQFTNCYNNASSRLSVPGVRVGGGTSFEDLEVVPPMAGVPLSPGGNGILVLGVSSLLRVFVKGFPGVGVLLSGSLSSVPPSNVSGWRIEGGQISACGHGLVVQGDDASGGVCTGLDIRDNVGWGLTEDSIFGNTYIAVLAHNNGAGHYRTGAGRAQNTSVFVGCYEEFDSPPNSITGPSMILGGTLSLGAHNSSICPTLKGGFGGQLKIFSSVQVQSQSGLAYAELGGAGSEAMAFGEIGSSYIFSLERGEPGSFAFANQGTPFLELLGPAHANAFRGGGGAISRPRMRYGYFVGDSLVATGAEAPSGGDWRVGDQVMNVAPSESSPFAGWICVSVTPLTWKPFGRIEFA